MEKIHVNIHDKNFIHSISEDGFDTASAGLEPTKLQWVRGLYKWDGVTVFTDYYLTDPVVDLVESKHKVAWLVEPKSIHPWAYDNILSVEDKFDKIYTHDADLLNRGDKYVRSIVGSCRVPKQDRKIYDKSKNISIIASHKRDTEGHQFRHAIIKACPELDAWGSGYKRFDSKLDPLKDYMFSIAVMNSRVDNYFTEILTDCIACGTVPIFWGTPNIGDFFNTDGIIEFANFDDFAKVKLSRDVYCDMLPAVKENFNRLSNYLSTDDYIADLIMKDFYEH